MQIPKVIQEKTFNSSYIVPLQNFLAEKLYQKSSKNKSNTQEIHNYNKYIDYSSNNVDTIREYKNKNYGSLINTSKYIQIH